VGCFDLNSVVFGYKFSGSHVVDTRCKEVLGLLELSTPTAFFAQGMGRAMPAGGHASEARF